MATTAEIEKLRRIYNSNRNQLEHINTLTCDKRTKNGIRAYLRNMNKVLRGEIEWDVSHQSYD